MTSLCVDFFMSQKSILTPNNTKAAKE